MSDLKSIDNIEIILSSIKSILKDPENGSIDSSVPPSLLLTLEQVRSTLQEQQDSIKSAAKLSKSSLEDAQNGKIQKQHLIHALQC